jgi:hypothetical protein
MENSDICPYAVQNFSSFCELDRSNEDRGGGLVLKITNPFPIARIRLRKYLYFVANHPDASYNARTRSKRDGYVSLVSAKNYFLRVQCPGSVFICTSSFEIPRTRLQNKFFPRDFATSGVNIYGLGYNLTDSLDILF